MGNKILSVKNLKISFRTMNGKVQAVRDISFDLFEDNTLAIVGESGSGKSVTSKAILGISAGNAIIEGGEIIYDGKDLLTISEEEFCKIRGDKIAMIFQDPLSSLNPIMRIGKQLTEAMLLKAKARQKESRNNFNKYLKLVAENMIASNPDTPKEEIIEKCKNFDKFEYKHVALERDYKNALEARDDALMTIDNLIFRLEKKAPEDLSYTVKKIVRLSKESINTYVVDARKDELLNTLPVISSQVKIIKRDVTKFATAVEALKVVKEILEETKDFVEPNFFCMGYYLTFANEPLPAMPVEELNVFLRKYLDEHFMINFRKLTEKALKNSSDKAVEGKKIVNAFLSQEGIVDELISNPEKVDELEKLVDDSIDKLWTVKDSQAYTFVLSVRKNIKAYYAAIKKNAKEQKRFDSETAKYDAKVKAGKNPDYKVAPLSLINLDDIKQNIADLSSRLVEHYERAIVKVENVDFDSKTVDLIDFFKACASGVVNTISRNAAKNKAITLMEEVGIHEPRKRFKQYPFEFSGGMRQRIVIAIALAANPNILICDEPTTALDVTIQAQILELINDLKKRRHLAVIFITHDLGVVANMADRIAVMYAGKIVEYGESEEIFYEPAHPYTRALLASMPDLDTNERLEAIPGTPPNMIYPPKGDAFADRNKYALKIDYEMEPPFFQVSPTHYAATWLLHPNAPKVEMPKAIKDRITRMKAKNAEENKKPAAKKASKKAAK